MNEWKKEKECLQTPMGTFCYQRRILYPAKLSIKYNGRIKTLSDTQSLHRFASYHILPRVILIEEDKGRLYEKEKRTGRWLSDSFAWKIHHEDLNSLEKMSNHFLKNVSQYKQWDNNNARKSKQVHKTEVKSAVDNIYRIIICTLEISCTMTIL